MAIFQEIISLDIVVGLTPFQKIKNTENEQTSFGQNSPVIIQILMIILKIDVTIK